jgi:maltose-binding protein MalE
MDGSLPAEAGPRSEALVKGRARARSGFPGGPKRPAPVYSSPPASANRSSNAQIRGSAEARALPSNLDRLRQDPVPEPGLQGPAHYEVHRNTEPVGDLIFQSDELEEARRHRERHQDVEIASLARLLPDPRAEDLQRVDGVTLSELGEEGSGVLNRATDSTNATSLFTSGEAPFLVSGPWSVAAALEEGVSFAVDPVPSFAEGAKARPLIGVQAFFVASGASDPDLAQNLAQAILNDPELSVILHEADPRVPALDEALRMVTDQDPNLEAFQRAGEGGLPMPAIPEMELVWSPFSQASADIIGGADVREAMEAAAQTITSG